MLSTGRVQRGVAIFLPAVVTLIILVPIALLTTELLTPSFSLWARMWNTFLPRVIRNTLVLVVGVGVGTTVLGTGFAWLVTAYDFPGRRIFAQALLLPLAIPGFIMGFTFTSIFEFAGPVQTFLRNLTGSELRYFPDITSAGGLILVMTLVLYPYVFVIARAAFREQAATTVEAAQVMGLSRMQTFFRLVLPLARPSIAAGAVLAMMEAMTEYGAVSFFGFPTLSERIVVIWNAEFDHRPAAELASLLLFVALAMIVVERLLRGQAQFGQKGGAHLRPKSLRGTSKWAAVLACAGLIAFAFVLPTVQLARWAVEEAIDPSVGLWRQIYFGYIVNSVSLAGIAAGVAVLLALIIAYGARKNAPGLRPRWLMFLARIATLGYAMPGSVVAAGVLLFVNPLDGPLTNFAANYLGWTRPEYLLTGTIVALVYAYVVRFMSIGFGSVESSMEKVTPNMEQAARTLGAGPWRVLWRIHTPLVSTGMAAGAILIFVDVMKELPATLLLRPFGMDTLALWAYFLSVEGFWEAAAIPSLTIVVVGLIPVFILMRVGDQTR